MSPAHFELCLRFTVAFFIGITLGLGIVVWLWCVVSDLRRERAKKLADRMDPCVRRLVTNKQIRR